MQRVYFDIHTSVGRSCARDIRFPYQCSDLIDDMKYYRVHGALIKSNESLDYNIFQGNEKSKSRAKENNPLYASVLCIPDIEFECDYAEEYLKNLRDKNVKAVQLAPKKMKHSFTPKSMKKIAKWIQNENLPVIMSIRDTSWNELEEFLYAYPDINVILTDTTWGTNRYLFSLLRRCDNLYFEISSNQANDILELTKRYFGIDRVLFGTNYPNKIMGGLKALVEYADLTEKEKDAVACDNALRLLNIDKKSLPLYEDKVMFDDIAKTMDDGKPFVDYCVIDAHAHMTGKGHNTVSDLVLRNGDADNMVKAMDDLGIDFTLAVPWEGISTNGINSNITCVKAMEKHPGRFKFYSSCNPNYKEDLESVIPDFHVKYPEFIGIKPYYTKHSYNILGERYKKWFEYANKNNMLMLVHTGVGNIHEKIPELCEKYPNISFILAHSGSNYVNADRLIPIAQKYENAYLEITYTSLTRGIIEYMVEKVGSDRVLFGTDAPMRDPAPQLAWIAYAKISKEDKIKIMSGNIKRILDKIVN